jgi:NodT family efflux transporter outer membrane factor (OMF) lipoprotein
MKFAPFIRSVALLLLLGSCTVGPDFVPPEPPQVDRFTADPLPSATAAATTTGGEAQRFDAPGRIPADWWALFHSSSLDTLIKEALAASPNLTAAEAALRQAHELRIAGQGAFFPLVQASFGASRNKSSSILAPVPSSNTLYYNLFTPQLSVSYVPDVFGSTRRTVEGLAAQEEAQRFQLEAAYLTLTSGLVAAAVGEAGLRDQIAATEDIVRIQQQALQILQRQLALGQVSGQDVAAQEAALAQAQATLPPLQKQLAQQRDLIALLTGRFPSQQPAAKFELAVFHLPDELPVSLPSQLVEQRPDIRVAAADLHAASAAVGVAVAARLPQLSLSADYGSTGLTVGSLFAPGTAFWTISGNVTQTIFDAGALLHKQRAAEATFDQAKAQYKETVLTAFQNVADSLEALKSDANDLAATAAAERAAKESLDIAQRQLRAGAVNYLGLLTAESTYEQALIARVQAQAARLADTAALFQALGGGWWNRQHQPGDKSATAAVLR